MAWVRGPAGPDPAAPPDLPAPGSAARGAVPPLSLAATVAGVAVNWGGCSGLREACDEGLCREHGALEGDRRLLLPQLAQLHHALAAAAIKQRQIEARAERPEPRAPAQEVAPQI